MKRKQKTRKNNIKKKQVKIKTINKTTQQRKTNPANNTKTPTGEKREKQ
jgi:hypothetical protein